MAKAVVGRWGCLAQGLVRPLVVVPGAVGVEDPLLPAGREHRVASGVACLCNGGARTDERQRER